MEVYGRTPYTIRFVYGMGEKNYTHVFRGPRKVRGYFAKVKPSGEEYFFACYSDGSERRYNLFEVFSTHLEAKNKYIDAVRLRVKVLQKEITDLLDAIDAPAEPINKDM